MPLLLYNFFHRHNNFGILATVATVAKIPKMPGSCLCRPRPLQYLLLYIITKYSLMYVTAHVCLTGSFYTLTKGSSPL